MAFKTSLFFLKSINKHPRTQQTLAQKTDPTDIDPKEKENAEAMWANFAQASKWSVISIAVVLIALYLLFI